MSTVINLPQGQTLSSGLGHTIGSLIAQQGAMKMQQLEAARFQNIQNSIANAPDRHTAVAIATQLPFRNMQEFEHTMKYLDQFHPQSEDATVDHVSYDAYGNKVTTAMSRAATRRTGPQTELPREDTYAKRTDGTYEYMGKHSANNIAPGESTVKGFDLMNTDKDNIRADKTANHTNTSEKRLQEGADLAKLQGGLNKFGLHLGELLGGTKKMNPDGSFSMEPESIPYDRRTAYRQGLVEADKLMQKHGQNYGTAVDDFLSSNSAGKSFITTEPPPAPVVAPVAPAKGAFTKIGEAVSSGVNTIKGMLPKASEETLAEFYARRKAENEAMLGKDYKQPNPMTIPQNETLEQFKTRREKSFNSIMNDPLEKVRSAVKGTEPAPVLKVVPNENTDPHNPTIHYPTSAADMVNVPDLATYKDPASGKLFVKNPSVAPPVVTPLAPVEKTGSTAAPPDIENDDLGKRAKAAKAANDLRGKGGIVDTLGNVMSDIKKSMQESRRRMQAGEPNPNDPRGKPTKQLDGGHTSEQAPGSVNIHDDAITMKPLDAAIIHAVEDYVRAPVERGENKGNEAYWLARRLENISKGMQDPVVLKKWQKQNPGITINSLERILKQGMRKLELLD